PDANKAITLDAKNPFAFNTRAQIYEALGRKQAAIADFRKVLKLKPGMQDAIEGLKRLGAEP
ncbi:MAG TPA: tetratricopeptide repeat protein, partial [Methyloceanibacter sp.]|nr:tetratricopeptide repeat protein [Methyloceanibacter sp.]